MVTDHDVGIPDLIQQIAFAPVEHPREQIFDDRLSDLLRLASVPQSVRPGLKKLMPSLCDAIDAAPMRRQWRTVRGFHLSSARKSFSSPNGLGLGRQRSRICAAPYGTTTVQSGQRRPNRFYIGQLHDLPPDQRNTRRFERMRLSSVSVLTTRCAMTGAVEFDRSNDAGVRSCDQEIYRELATPVPNCLITAAALESQRLDHLHLRQN